MKISLSWLRELVELPPTVDTLVDLLTLAGVEVEGVDTRGCAIDKVIVAQIQESVQHPNADRLSVCQVDDGSGTARQIVCGAKNYKVGDKVPLALPGAKLGADFTIKVGKLRGVESQGMMCSAKELALADDAEGLLILPPDSAVGTPIGALFPSDTILDLEITPNRADLLSVNGIAREIGALTGRAVRLAGPKSAPAELPAPTLAVTTADCPLYTARRIEGVKVGPSPEWLRARLEAVGLRSINNVVDVMNYTMLELGEPLHAFDAAKLDGALNVRAARDGEEFAALDGKTYRLAGNHMVIADAARAVAVAGVMGGADSGVTEWTTAIWIESAYFDSRSIRRTSRQLGLASDSSYRFERGVDPCGIVEASQRATELVVEICGGVAGEMNVGQTCSLPAGPGNPAAAAFPTHRADYKSASLSLRPLRVAALLGVAVSEARIDGILAGFGLTKSADGWQAPSFRPDLTREVDLIEEIARVVGMDAIPARVQAPIAAASPSDAAYDRAMALRRALLAHGLHEARSLTLVPAEPRGVAFTQTSLENLLRVKNPMIDDQVVLRPGLLHGLLSAVATNVRAGAASVRLFEIGRVFSALGTDGSEEATHVALVLSGTTSERSWREAEGRPADLYDLKGILTAALGSGVTFQPDGIPTLALSLLVAVNGQPVGFAGQLWPADARAIDATAPVLFAEIDLARLAVAQSQNPARKYRDIPRFPAVTRDIALLAPLALSHAAIESALHASREPLLTSVALFDVFTDPSGARVPADQKSLAYSLTYRAADRTLTADEVNAAHGRLKEQLRSQLGVALRE